MAADGERFFIFALLSLAAMTPIRSYSTRVEADLARIALEAEGIAATVVGVDITMDAGADGVRLLVADDEVDAARKVLAKAQPGAAKRKT